MTKTIRGFSINNPELKRQESDPLQKLRPAQQASKVANERRIKLNNDGPSSEKDLLSYFREPDEANTQQFCTMRRLARSVPTQVSLFDILGVKIRPAGGASNSPSCSRTIHHGGNGGSTTGCCSMGPDSIFCQECETDMLPGIDRAPSTKPLFKVLMIDTFLSYS